MNKVSVAPEIEELQLHLNNIDPTDVSLVLTRLGQATASIREKLTTQVQTQLGYRHSETEPISPLELNETQKAYLLARLENRMRQNPPSHYTLPPTENKLFIDNVLNSVKNNPRAMSTLYLLERTDGEPNVRMQSYDNEGCCYVFVCSSKHTPNGGIYDRWSEDASIDPNLLQQLRADEQHFPEDIQLFLRHGRRQCAYDKKHQARLIQGGKQLVTLDDHFDDHLSMDYITPNAVDTAKLIGCTNIVGPALYTRMQDTLAESGEHDNQVSIYGFTTPNDRDNERIVILNNLSRNGFDQELYSQAELDESSILSVVSWRGVLKVPHWE